MLQIYKDYLNSQNIAFEEESFGLVFKYQGGNFIVDDPGADDNFLRLVMPGIYSINLNDSKEIIKAYESMNEINRGKKVVKAHLHEDMIWLSTEIFIDSTPELDDFFFRLLQILFKAKMEFVHHVTN